MDTKKKVLVAYFSRMGENYAVGNITKGNTRIIAEMIAESMGGKLFEIVPVDEYPTSYDACIDRAKKEQRSGARPAIKDDTVVEDYDIVFVGYPNWWGDMPMAVYTFIEKHQWDGKIVIPFCTHEGSGLAGTERLLANACNGAELKKGFAIRGAKAQNQQVPTQDAVAQWLDNLDL